MLLFSFVLFIHDLCSELKNCARKGCRSAQVTLQTCFTWKGNRNITLWNFKHIVSYKDTSISICNILFYNICKGNYKLQSLPGWGITHMRLSLLFYENQSWWSFIKFNNSLI